MGGWESRGDWRFNGGWDSSHFIFFNTTLIFYLLFYFSSFNLLNVFVLRWILRKLHDLLNVFWLCDSWEGYSICSIFFTMIPEKVTRFAQCFFSMIPEKVTRFAQCFLLSHPYKVTRFAQCFLLWILRKLHDLLKGFFYIDSLEGYTIEDWESYTICSMFFLLRFLKKLHDLLDVFLCVIPEKVTQFAQCFF